MIDTDETGQRKLESLLASLEDGRGECFNDWERGFLDEIQHRMLNYQKMSSKQKGVVSNLWDKMVES